MTTPTNKNFSPNHSGRLHIKRLPHITFFAQKYNVPGLTLPAVERHSPLADLRLHGDKLQFKDLVVSFVVDEDLKNWEEIFDWMIGLGFPESNDQFAALKNGSKELSATFGDLYSTAMLQILTAKKNPRIQLEFQDIFPTDLSDIEYVHTNDNTEYQIATVTFKYSLYRVTRLS